MKQGIVETVANQRARGPTCIETMREPNTLHLQCAYSISSFTERFVSNHLCHIQKNTKISK